MFRIGLCFPDLSLGGCGFEGLLRSLLYSRSVVFRFPRLVVLGPFGSGSRCSFGRHFWRRGQFRAFGCGLGETCSCLVSAPSASSAVGFAFSVVASLVLRNILHGCLKGFPQDFLLREFVVDVRALSTGGYRSALFLGLGELLLRLSLRSSFLFLLFLGPCDLLFCHHCSCQLFLLYPRFSDWVE